MEMAKTLAADIRMNAMEMQVKTKLIEPDTTHKTGTANSAVLDTSTARPK